MAITVEMSARGANLVAEYLKRTIPTQCPISDTEAWESVMNALFAFAYDTYAIIHESEIRRRADDINFPVVE